MWTSSLKFCKISWNWHYLLLLVITLIGYWQVSLFQNPLKWDMIDQYYPWRYFVGDCLRHHSLPYWNPYQFLGYPINADPQSGAWYPVVWFIGYFYGYDIYSISFEFILHIFLAGVGMYRLANYFSFGKKIALFIGISYLFSGFFIGNSQHMTYIVSGTWIPYVLLFYLKTRQTRSWLDALKTGFFLSLLLTGGYPAFAFILGYFMLVVFLYYSVSCIRSKNKSSLFNWIKINGLIMVAVLLLSSASLISIYVAFPHITRGAGLTLERALICPFSPQCSISFLLPFSVIKNMDFFLTDLSMTNAYFGLIPFIFFLYSLLIKKTKLMWLFLAFGFFALTAAFGGYLPVREFLFRYVPLMNLFRFPSIFRLFTIISFLLLSGYGLQLFLPDAGLNNGKVKNISIAVLLLLLTFLFYARSQGPIGIIGFVKSDLFTFSKKTALFQHIAFQSIVQIMLTIVFIILIYKIPDRNKLLNYIIGLLLLDMILVTRLNAPYTVYSEEFKSEMIKAHGAGFPKDYPLPPDKNILEIADTGMGLNVGPLWRNLNIFQKQTAFDGYNPFFLKNLQFLEDSFPDLFFATMKNRLIFLSDQVGQSESIYKKYAEHPVTNKSIYFDRQDWATIEKMKFKSSKGDTLKITQLSPTKIVAEVKTTFPQMITLLQNNYPGWKLKINGVETKIVTSNFCFMSAAVPSGSSKLEFYYSSGRIFAGFILSASSFFLFLLIICIDYLKSFFSMSGFGEIAAR